jgi:hypothetical protein
VTEARRSTLAIVAQFLNLAVLVIGVAGVFLSVGRRDERLNTNTAEIRDLRDIATDLVKASIESTTTNREQDRRLDDLRNRLAALETRP